METFLHGGIAHWLPRLSLFDGLRKNERGSGWRVGCGGSGSSSSSSSSSSVVIVEVEVVVEVVIAAAVVVIVVVKEEEKEEKEEVGEEKFCPVRSIVRNEGKAKYRTLTSSPIVTTKPPRLSPMP
ncbi:hypothetical protein HZH66_004237 [Vespula vulgaris]|uniref:Uncharacterized protein n=1 Tax=Vespula vulgaris TaxID=7454 RepID=A0A834KJQ9_VESVU|nr:hypothetical protein HZH66_004237 [Vespula vulgaris]